MTLSFMVINTFFFSNDEQAILDAKAKQEQVDSSEQKELIKRALNNKPSISDLNIVQIYDQPSAQTPLTTGSLIDDNIVFFSWDNQLSSKIYYRPLNSSADLKEASYSYGTESQDSPQIYSLSSEEKTPLKYVHIGDLDDIDLVLLTPNKGNTPNLSIGIWNHSQLNIPSDPPSHSALVLVKQGDAFYPCGVYQLPEKHFVPLSLYPNIRSSIASEKFSMGQASTEAVSEKLYVLQNDLQQLVFSNIGASLVNVNLPFESEEHPNSVVRSLEWDRLLEKESPVNSRFPLQTAQTYNGELKPIEGGYFPLLRRDLQITPNNRFTLPHSYRACTITSDYPELASLPFKVSSFTNNEIVFEASQAQRKIIKKYTLPKDSAALPYTFDLEIEIQGDSRSLWINSGLLEAEITSGIPPATLKYAIEKQNKVEDEEISLPKPGESSRMGSVHPVWYANCNSFFGVILYPQGDIGSGYRAQGIAGVDAPTRLSLIDTQYDRFPVKDFPSYNLMLPLSSRPGKTNLKIFAGPLDSALLRQVDTTITNETGNNPMIIESLSFHGWFPFISKPISKFLFLIMHFFQTYTHSWGLSIILLTVVLRLFLYPLSAWSFKSMKRMQLLSPQVQAIQKKYKKEPKKAQMEVMALYRKEKANPFMGCLPILIQMPFLIGMFDLLRTSFSLRGQTFIPGWINNLAAPDILFQWTQPIFYIGTEFHFLPVLIGGIMFLQQKLSSSLPKDPKLLTDQQRQQKAMGSIMTIFFTIMFYNLPSGVNLYWLSSMGLGVLQQWYTNKVLEKQFGSKNKDIIIK